MSNFNTFLFFPKICVLGTLFLWFEKVKYKSILNQLVHVETL